MPGKPRNFRRLPNGQLAMVVVDDRNRPRTIIIDRRAEAAFTLDYLATVITDRPLPARNWANDSYEQGQP